MKKQLSVNAVLGFIFINFIVCPFILAQEVASVPAMTPAGAALPSLQPALQAVDRVQADQEKSLQDHQAAVLDVSGQENRFLKKGSDQWQVLKKDQVIQEGDQIITGPDGFVIIHYDAESKNIVKIDSKSKAEFRSIEPTDLHLEDGSIFNILDGLGGVAYQISTPTAVAAVRGTHLPVSYDASTGAFYAAVLDEKDSFLHKVEITDFNIEGEKSTVVIAEGMQVQTENSEESISEPKAISVERQSEFETEKSEILELLPVAEDLKAESAEENISAADKAEEKLGSGEEKVETAQAVASDSELEVLADQATGTGDPEDLTNVFEESSATGAEFAGDGDGDSTDSGVAGDVADPVMSEISEEVNSADVGDMNDASGSEGFLDGGQTGSDYAPTDDIPREVADNQVSDEPKENKDCKGTTC